MGPGHPSIEASYAVAGALKGTIAVGSSPVIWAGSNQSEITQPLPDSEFVCSGEGSSFGSSVCEQKRQVWPVSGAASHTVFQHDPREIGKLPAFPAAAK